MSLLARERGLKPMWLEAYNKKLQVAPCTGAWIETGHAAKSGHRSASLLARERGLKLTVP